MRKDGWTVKALGLCLMAWIMLNEAGCSSPLQLKSESPGISLHNHQQQVMKEEDGFIPLRRVNGIPFVSGNDLCRVLELRMRWNPATGVFIMGDEDGVYELQIKSLEAVSAGRKTKLPETPILADSVVLIPIVSLGSLFRDEFHYDVSEEYVKFKPAVLLNQASGKVRIADDPQYVPQGAEQGGGMRTESEAPTYRAPGKRQQDQRSELSQRAERYVGVGYEFAAAPFPESGTFDSSSYTKYVFERLGIQLERTARQQSEQGTTVAPDRLRKGDLLFFTVPGRYKSNQIGHVGIYLGEQSMIHVLPEQGVQITKLDTSDWDQRFVKAQRVMP